jgi:hypothetical protein
MATAALLTSWKEIATYLNKGIRTVQRWECELGLPVRRPRAAHKQTVLAMPSELDEWMHDQTRTRSRPHPGTVHISREKLEQLQANVTRTMEETRRLCRRAAELRKATILQ